MFWNKKPDPAPQLIAPSFDCDFDIEGQRVISVERKFRDDIAVTNIGYIARGKRGRDTVCEWFMVTTESNHAAMLARFRAKIARRESAHNALAVKTP